MTFQPPDDSAFIAAMQSAKDRAEDFERSQRAQAGLETGDGNSHNHLIQDIDPLTGERKKKGSSNRSALSALDLALQNPAYQQAYQELNVALTDAQTHVFDALQQAADDVKDAEDALKQAQRDGASDAEIKAKQKAVYDARKRQQKLEEHERELDRIRRHMEDPDNPPTAEEIDAYKKRIDQITRDVEGLNFEIKEEPERPLQHTEISQTDNFKPIF